MKIINSILRRLIKDDSHLIFTEILRNDECFCNSGLKYKKCHQLKLLPKNKVAYKVKNTITNKESIKILKIDNRSKRMKSKLLWEDIGGGGLGKIDP